MPEIDGEKCTLCGKCVEICNFNALAKAKDKIILFDKLCHSCGACILACPMDAINLLKGYRVIEKGKRRNFIKRGLLNIGEPISVPILKELLKDLPEEEINLLDSPPGTSCNVVQCS